jgi:hypothetical protein
VFGVIRLGAHRGEADERLQFLHESLAMVLGE